MNCFTKKIDKSLQESLKNFFIDEGAQVAQQQYAFWNARGNGYSATFYNSGKFLIQGADVTLISQKVESFLGIDNQLSFNNVIDDIPVFDIPVKHIGVDESGKGDFFGPLVIAGVLVDENNSRLLLDSGVKDCKMVDDKNINKLAALIKNNCVFSIVTINPTKYNELYAKFKNLNHLLAWGHARAIENILEKAECSYALSDKFGDESLIKNALMNKGKNIKLEQRCKGESDIAVAAASIIARAQFLSGMKELSNKYCVDIPKGASEKVKLVAKGIANKYSKDELKNAVKTHFKTFSEI